MIRTSCCLVESLFLVLVVLSLHRLPYPSGDSQSKCFEHKRKGNNVHTKIQQNPKDFQTLKPKTSSKTIKSIPPNPKSHFHHFHPSTFPLFTRFALPSVRWPFENALWAKLVVKPWLVPPLPKPSRCLPAPSSTRSLKKNVEIVHEIVSRKSCPRFAKNVFG